MTMQPPDQLDEDKLREERNPCAECGCELGDHDSDTMLCWEHPSCPGHTEITGEPDYEQIIEDRAARHGPDPEAVMWGGEDIPS
jgi:hypothetical protein